MQAAQQHFQAVTAGLSSGADGQEETLAAQKIGTGKLPAICCHYYDCDEFLSHSLFLYFSACENEISNAVTEIKQAEMR